MRERTDFTKRPPPQEPLAYLLAARAGLKVSQNQHREYFQHRKIISCFLPKLTFLTSLS